ncbi:MAG: hypothetical protein VCA38_15795 [Roseibacillus sp.]|jgi:hypothetical protein
MSQTSFGGPFRPTLVLVAAVSLVPVLTVADVSRSGLDEERTFSDSGVDYKITYNDSSTSSHRISSSDVDDLEDFAMSEGKKSLVTPTLQKGRAKPGEK